jgi:2-polyprenyl-3-methyl-5-hydroxy-6-metoxy-1,4-benzoquinol methylase
MINRCPLCNNIEIDLIYRIERYYLGKPIELLIAKCNHCNFIFLINDPCIMYDEEYFNHEIVAMDDNLASFVRFHAQERIKNISKIVSPSFDNKFLDFGIGDGLLLSLAEKAGYSTFGLDINEAAISIAKKCHNLDAEIRLGSFEDGFPDQIFNVIHLNEVLEHISDVTRLLSWCREHLSTGLLVIQTGNIDSLAAKIKGKDWDYFRPGHVSYFSEKTLTFALHKAGFKVISRGTVDWEIQASLKQAEYTLNRFGFQSGVKFIALYLTSLINNIRRSILVYAV